MDLEQFQFTLSGFNAFEVYPFAEKTQRYFTATHHNHAGAIYRIVAYPQKLVKVEELLLSLALLKEQHHPALPKIVEIIADAVLRKKSSKAEEQTVVAVVYEQVPTSEMLSFYDFILKLGPLPEKLTKHFVHQLLCLVETMHSQGMDEGLAAEDVFIDYKTGKILLDSYGLRKHFKIQEPMSDLHELGSFLFTCLKMTPPYRNKSNLNPHYSCLMKQQFQKFWSLFPPKSIENPSDQAISFFNECFTSGKSTQSLRSHPWLSSYVPMANQEVESELKNRADARTTQRQEAEVKKRARREKIMKSVRERNNAGLNRGSNSEDLIEVFLEKLSQEETDTRSIYESEDAEDHRMIELAYLLAQLHENKDNDVRISDLSDNGDMISFRVRGQVEEAIELDSVVELDLKQRGGRLPFRFHRISGPLYDGLWVREFVSSLCLYVE